MARGMRCQGQSCVLRPSCLSASMSYDDSSRNGPASSCPDAQYCHAADRRRLMPAKHAADVAWSALQVGQDSLQSCLERKADEKRALLRRPEYDPPACVAEGLFIGEHHACDKLLLLMISRAAQQPVCAWSAACLCIVAY